MRESSNRALSGVPKDILLSACMVLIATGGFGLGYLAGKGGGVKSDGFWVENIAATTTAAVAPAAAAVAVSHVVAPASIPVSSIIAPSAPATGEYMASKNGTKYYLPTCSGAKRIKPENVVWFATKADAEAAGLGPAANCPGL